MALSPGGGIMSNYFVVVMGKYSQNNLRTKCFTTDTTILSFSVFTLNLKATNHYEFVRVATYILIYLYDFLKDEKIASGEKRINLL